TACLGVFDAEVKKISAQNLKVPQIGWNTIAPTKNPLFKNIDNPSYVYFVHSFYGTLNDYTIAKTSYGDEYSSAIANGNFFGVQFHPDKSAAAGDQILKNFIELEPNLMEIIPAIDIIEGKCVRLTQGDFGQKKIYHDNPLEIAKKFESAGIQRLHVVDLDGAKTGNVQNWVVLKQIASHTGLKIDFGGGIKDPETAGRILNDGASWITIGSMAVKDPATFDRMYETFDANIIRVGAIEMS